MDGSYVDKVYKKKASAKKRLTKLRNDNNHVPFGRYRMEMQFLIG